MEKAIKLKTPIEAIHIFAQTLTTRVRELDELERKYAISTNQSTEILCGMIESQLYAIFKTMVHSNVTRPEENEAAFNSMLQLIDSGLLAPKPQQGEK